MIDRLRTENCSEIDNVSPAQIIVGDQISNAHAGIGQRIHVDDEGVRAKPTRQRVRAQNAMEDVVAQASRQHQVVGFVERPKIEPEELSR
ncbi:hypothetical protein D3C87_1972590 [compost metagenome]